MKISIKETLKNHKGNVEHQSILLASISTDVDARRHRRLRKGIESLNHNNFTIALPSFAMVATTNDLLCRRRRGHGNYSRSPKLIALSSRTRSLQVLLVYNESSGCTSFRLVHHFGK